MNFNEWEGKKHWSPSRGTNRELRRDRKTALTRSLALHMSRHMCRGWTTGRCLSWCVKDNMYCVMMTHLGTFTPPPSHHDKHETLMWALSPHYSNIMSTSCTGCVCQQTNIGSMLHRFQIDLFCEFLNTARSCLHWPNCGWSKWNEFLWNIDHALLWIFIYLFLVSNTI